MWHGGTRRIARKSLRYLVGPPGFEPGTSCTPSKRASQAAPRPEVYSLAQPRLTPPNPSPSLQVVSSRFRALFTHILESVGLGARQDYIFLLLWSMQSHRDGKLLHHKKQQP